jgi:hypothetical protein
MSRQKFGNLSKTFFSTEDASRALRTLGKHKIEAKIETGVMLLYEKGKGCRRKKIWWIIVERDLIQRAERLLEES